MTNKQVIDKCIDNEHGGQTYKIFKNNRPPGKKQERLLDKYKIPCDVDPEIRNIVIELNEKGIKTLGSCAGHKIGKWKGFVTIGDYKKIRIHNQPFDFYKNTDIRIVKKIFKKHGIEEIRFNRKLWIDWFAIEFKSVGKDLDLSIHWIDNFGNCID